ncbi:unnamed protein product, partial [Prorocentrum cordatum]
VVGEILEGAAPLSENPMEAVEEVREGTQACREGVPRLLQFFDVESCRFSDSIGFHHLLASLKRQQIDGQIELVQN